MYLMGEVRHTMPSFRHARHSPAQFVLRTHSDRLFTGCYEEDTYGSITNSLLRAL